MIDMLIKALRNKANELNQTADSLERLGNTLGPLFVDVDSNKRKASRAIIERINERNKNSFDALNMTDPAKFPSKKKFIEKWTMDEAKEVIREGFNEAVKQKEKKTAKGYKYKPGTHWTQKPENAAKLKRVVKNMAKVNKAKV